MHGVHWLTLRNLRFPKSVTAAPQYVSSGTTQPSIDTLRSITGYYGPAANHAERSGLRPQEHREKAALLWDRDGHAGARHRSERGDLHRRQRRAAAAASLPAARPADDGLDL